MQFLETERLSFFIKPTHEVQCANIAVALHLGRLILCKFLVQRTLQENFLNFFVVHKGYDVVDSPPARNGAEGAKYGGGMFSNGRATGHQVPSVFSVLKTETTVVKEAFLLVSGVVAQVVKTCNEADDHGDLCPAVL